MDRCSECKARIKNGEIRHICCECACSFVGFKVCDKCHAKGIARKHMDGKGYLHWFEHRNSATIDPKQFDKPLEDMLRTMFSVYADRPSFGRYVESQKRYEYFRYSELGKFTENFASGLQHLMSSEWDKMVAIFAKSRVEWFVTDLACILMGVTTVGVPFSCDKETLSYMLNQTASSIIVCSSRLLDQVLSVSTSCPNLKLIVVMDLTQAIDDVNWESHLGCQDDEDRIVKFTKILSLGEKHAMEFHGLNLSPEDPWTIFYTSGTTGRPKGCVHLRQKLRNQMWMCRSQNLGDSVKSVILSFQPLSHVMERFGMLSALATGGMIGLYRGSMENLVEDIRMVRPTYLLATPHFFSTLYKEYLQALDQACHEEGILVSDKHLDFESVPAEIRERVLSKFKGYLGGRQSMVVLAGSTTQSKLRNFVEQCFDHAMIADIYGTSETGRLLTEGEQAITGDICLIDVPEMGYLTTDNPPRGEICVKSADIVQGYYKNEEATKEKFVNGYFRTGDIGVQESPGAYRIIDRKKSIFKLAQGEFVVPERIEGIFENGSHLIEQVFVYGSSTKTGTVAVVVPFQPGLMQWWEQRHLGDVENGIEDLCSYEDVQELYLAELRSLGKSHGLQGWEIPQAILLEPHPFTPENRLLTSTYKKSRPSLERKYQSQLDGLYASVRSLESNITSHFLLVMREKGVQVPNGLDDSAYPSSPIAPLDLSLTLTQLGGDSLVAMRMASWILEQFAVEVSAEVFLQTPLHDILHGHVLNALLPNQEMSSSKPKQVPQEMIDWKKEMDISFLESEFGGQGEEMVLPSMVSVLLTGGSGFVGKFVLWQLMQDLRCEKIYCLLREKKASSVQESLNSLLTSIALELLGPACTSERLKSLMAKVVGIAGDVSLPNLGMKKEVYKELLSEVNVVIHGAANVNHVLPYFALKQTNVGGTMEVLKFCCQGKPKFLHYISTIAATYAASSCSQPDHKGNLQSTGYAITKWVSEQLVLQAIGKGRICGSVSRPGMVGAHSVTGHSNQHDWFFQLVCGIKRMGCYPAGLCTDDMKTDIIPVDVLAKAIVFLSIDLQLSVTRDRETNSAFDIVNVNQDAMVTTVDIIKALQKVVPGLHSMDDAHFVSLLSSRARTTGDVILGSLDLLLPEIFLVMSMGGMVRGSPTPVATMLQSAGINVLAKVDKYMEKYVKYLTEKELL